MLANMDPLSIVVTGVALAAMLGAVGMLVINRRQDKRRGVAEETVAKAAQDYFARFQIHARTIGSLLPDDSMVLMVETPPHKKLRFSYIIEPPIKNFIHVTTGIQVARIFWRFPIPTQKTNAPDVKYVDMDADTIPLDLAPTPPVQAPVASAVETDVETDDYFYQHQTYHIEEVSWEDFSTVTQTPAGTAPTTPPPSTTKK